MEDGGWGRCSHPRGWPRTKRDVFSSILVEVMLATCSGEMTKNTATKVALHSTEGERAENDDSLGSQFQMV